MGILKRIWRPVRTTLRLAGSSICFQTFFYVGLLMATFLVPLVRLLSRDGLRARHRILRIVSLCFWVFMHQMVLLRMLAHYKVTGARARRGLR